MTGPGAVPPRPRTTDVEGAHVEAAHVGLHHRRRSPVDYAVVIPTIGRASLVTLLDSLAAQAYPPAQLVVVDDRSAAADPGADRGADRGATRAALDAAAPLEATGCTVTFLVTGGRGPAAARNAGWRATTATWVVFLDDDVVVPPTWSATLATDLLTHAASGGVSGAIVVPRPPGGRRPTDAERGTIGLEGAWWPTADMAYRRAALQQTGGFDERFRRAYREDADLALRVRECGWSLARGRRYVVHPLKTGDAWSSLRAQRGNADDALMRRLHGRHWRTRAQTGRGALAWHAASLVGAVLALAGTVTGRRRIAWLGAGVYAGITARTAAQRVLAGPPAAGEVAAMLATSVAIPPAAVAHRLAGTWRHRNAAPWRAVRAVLLDRDGTLVHDVPYNGDPGAVRPVRGAARAVDRLRTAGLAIGVVTNQSGIARGVLTADDTRRVAQRIEDLVGPMDTWHVCPHAPEQDCACRKPAPGMVLAAAEELRVLPSQVVLIGDIGSDVEAALAAGARAVLVPTELTRPEEVAGAPCVARTLSEAVDLVLADAVPTARARR